MTASEDGLASAEQRVREAEARIARQAAVVEGFELAGDRRGAEQAGEALAMMRASSMLAHLCVLVELARPDDGLERPGPVSD